VYRLSRPALSSTTAVARDPQTAAASEQKHGVTNRLVFPMIDKTFFLKKDPCLANRFSTAMDPVVVFGTRWGEWMSVNGSAQKAKFARIRAESK
jgi:hypothetical protein